MVKKEFTSFIILIFAIIGGLNLTYAQSSFLTCAWEKVALKKEANSSSNTLQTLSYGDQVSVMGGLLYVADENITYIKVESIQEKVGWVDQFLFMENATRTVILEEATIFERPNTPSTITMSTFTPGQEILRGKYSNGWVFVSSKNKKNLGWIKSDIRYSQAKKDLDLAQKWSKLKDLPLEKRKKDVIALVKEADSKSSPLAQIILESDEDVAFEMVEIERKINARNTSRSINKRSQPEKPQAKTGQFKQRLVWDAVENEYFTEVVETGPAIPVVKTIEYNTPFYAYHKTLEVGTEIKLDLPDNSGFVQLVIMGRLPEDSPAILALPPLCLSSVFGTTQPGDIVISYRK
ncbi:MAG: hypothetical protein MRZ79_01000 [Bacteroidia bacterium]|nr:hypothetical protein [Bacteroidia bacterium]